MVDVVTGIPQLQARLHAISGPALGLPIMKRLAISTVREAKILAPRKTSNLSRTIHPTTVTATSAVVVASAKYAPFVEFATRPHIIRARFKKALRFAATAAGRRLTGTPRVGAAVIFAAFVNHPGTKAQPFLRPGAEKAIQTAGLADLVVTNWNDAA